MFFTSKESGFFGWNFFAAIKFKRLFGNSSITFFWRGDERAKKLLKTSYKSFKCSQPPPFVFISAACQYFKLFFSLSFFPSSDSELETFFSYIFFFKLQRKSSFFLTNWQIIFWDISLAPEEGQRRRNSVFQDLKRVFNFQTRWNKLKNNKVQMIRNKNLRGVFD